MKHKLIFFDFDGTIMNTAAGIYAGGRYAMEKEGLKIPDDLAPEDWRKFIGPPLWECFKITFGVNDTAMLDKLVIAYREFYHEKGKYMAEFYPGMVELFQKLKQNNVLLAEASMKNDDLVREMNLHFGIDKYFDGVFGLNLAGTNTKADCLREGMKFFGLSKEDCVLVGDTTIDQHGAEEAGIDFVPVNWGFGFYPGDEGTCSNVEEVLERL